MVRWGGAVSPPSEGSVVPGQCTAAGSSGSQRNFKWPGGALEHQVSPQPHGRAEQLCPDDAPTWTFLPFAHRHGRHPSRGLAWPGLACCDVLLALLRCRWLTLTRRTSRRWTTRARRACQGEEQEEAEAAEAEVAAAVG